MNKVSKNDLLTMRRSATSSRKWWRVSETEKELALLLVAQRAYAGCSVLRINRCEAVVMARRRLVQDSLWLLPFDGSINRADGRHQYEALLYAIDTLLLILQESMARALTLEVVRNADQHAKAYVAGLKESPNGS